MVSIKKLLTLRRNYNKWLTPKKITSGLTKQFVSEFKEFYSDLVDSTIVKTKYIHSEELKSHIKMLSEYYTLPKFHLQGESFVYAYELLEKPENITEKMKRQAFTLACFIETCQAYFIIADDICDGGQTRNQKVCWHRLPGVGITAVNDISMLRSFTNEYLRLNIDRNIYSRVMDVINGNDFTEYLELTDSITTHKLCTDIQEGKCSWVAVKVLELCNSEQRRFFEDNYGSYDPSKVKQIKKLYTDLGLGELYSKEAQVRYDSYLQKVKKLCVDSVPSQDFFIKIYDLFRSYSDNLSRYYFV